MVLPLEVEDNQLMIVLIHVIQEGALVEEAQEESTLKPMVGVEEDLEQMVLMQLMEEMENKDLVELQTQMLS